MKNDCTGSVRGGGGEIDVHRGGALADAWDIDFPALDLMRGRYFDGEMLRKFFLVKLKRI